jgi:pyrroline-5-carboxylate reductase
LPRRSSSVSARPSGEEGLTLLVGAGRMGGALLKGWLAQEISPIAVVEPNPGEHLLGIARAHGLRLVETVEEIVGSRVAACVVALKPQVLRIEAVRLRPIARSGALMISIAAGTSIASLRKAWGRALIVRAMPNTPGAIGKGITALYAPRSVAREQRQRAERLMAGLGETLWVDREAWIDTVTAVSGSGPAYVFLFAEALATAARAEGLPDVIANRLARATVSGAGALLESDRRHAADLRADVTSPGGTTEAALRVLMKKAALAKLVGQAVAAANSRARQLREEG